MVIVRREGNLFVIELETTNLFGELLILKYVVNLKNGKRIKINKKNIAERILPNRSLMKDDLELEPKDMEGCNRLVREEIKKELKQSNVSFNNVVCPYCGAPDLSLQYPYRGEILQVTCPNCGKTYRLPDSTPLFWKRNKKHKGGD